MGPLAKLGFARHNIRLLTDDAGDPRNLPTKDNIVRRPSGMSLLPLHFVQLAAMRALVYDAQPGDSFFFYCTVIRLGQSKRILMECIGSLSSFGARRPDQRSERR